MNLKRKLQKQRANRARCYMKIHLPLFIWLLFVPILFYNCTNDISQEVNDHRQEKALLQVSFTPPVVHAADPRYATEEEVVLTTVDVYIYEDDFFVLHAPLTIDDFDDIGDNVWQLKDESLISVYSGVKQIYVGVNIPLQYQAVFRNMDNPAQNISTILNDLNNEETGFAMFNSQIVEAEFVSEYVISVFVPVERILAKVAVFTNNSTYTVEEDGIFSGLQYTVWNNNTKFFLFRKDNYEDPNFTQEGWENEDYKGELVGDNQFLFVEQDPGIYNNYYNVKYPLENTTEVYNGNSYHKLLQTATYVIVSAVFQPYQITYLNGTDWLPDQSNTFAAGTTFYRVTYPDGSTEYIVEENEDRNNVFEYAWSTIEENYSQVKVETYHNGTCYYATFVGETNNDIRRNYFYIAHITDITGLGYPKLPGINEGVDPDPDPDPEDPEPPEPPTPPGPGPGPDVETLLKVEVEVHPWFDDKEQIIIDTK